MPKKLTNGISVTPRRFLNVKYANKPVRIDTQNIEEFSQIQKEIKLFYADDSSEMPASRIQLWKETDTDRIQCKTLRDVQTLGDEYFKESEDGGLTLTVEVEASSFKLRRSLTERFQSFVNAKLVDNCIESSQGILLPYSQDKIKKVFVRKCYVDVFDLLMNRIGEGKESFAISGTPGVGKSVFFVYLLFKFMKDVNGILPFKPRRVVYQRDQVFACYDLEQKCVFDCRQEDALDIVDEPSTLYVMDGKLSIPLDSNCVTLFISSPRSEFYKEFVKQKKARQWYFPIWTKEELDECRSKCYPYLPANICNERYRVYGGVARYFFDDDESKNPVDDMEAKLRDLDAVKGVRNVGAPTDIFPTAHALLHVIVSDDELYRFLHVDLASEYVGYRLWELHDAQMLTNLREMFGGSPNVIAGHLFEIYGHRVFSRGGRTLQCRSLEDSALSNITLDALDGQQINFREDSIPIDDLSGKYYVPSKDNFPAIDSLSSQGMFQFTVSAEHEIRGIPTLKKICKLFIQPNLYFVVPQHQFVKFKKQRIQQSAKAIKSSDSNETIIEGLKQYVIELPV